MANSYCIRQSSFIVHPVTYYQCSLQIISLFTCFNQLPNEWSRRAFWKRFKNWVHGGGKAEQAGAGTMRKEAGRVYGT